MNRDQTTEHPTRAGNYLKLEKQRECEPMARGILAREALAPTPSWPKRGDFRKIEPIRVSDQGTLGWEEASQSGSGSDPFRQRTTTSAVLFFKKCS